MIISCNTALYQLVNKNGDRNVIIPELFPCTISEVEEIQMGRILPLQWSKMETGSLEINLHSTFKFRNMTKIFNQDW